MAVRVLKKTPTGLQVLKKTHSGLWVSIKTHNAQALWAAPYCRVTLWNWKYEECIRFYKVSSTSPVRPHGIYESWNRLAYQAFHAILGREITTKPTLGSTLTFTSIYQTSPPLQLWFLLHLLFICTSTPLRLPLPPPLSLPHTFYLMVAQNITTILFQFTLCTFPMSQAGCQQEFRNSWHGTHRQWPWITSFQYALNIVPESLFLLGFIRVLSLIPLFRKAGWEQTQECWFLLGFVRVDVKHFLN